MQLKSLDEIFEKRLFRIPDYQRGYAWGTKQLVDFWEDILNLDDKRFHYTGVLSIKKVEQEKWRYWPDEVWLIDSKRYVPFFVVDGQQRLTTASILIQCIVEAVRNLPENIGKADSEIILGKYYELEEIIEKFIVVSPPRSNIIKTYKFGYEKDNPSFEYLRHKVFGESQAGTVNETFYTLNLQNAKNFFTENIAELVMEEGESVLEQIFRKLTEKFMFNLYEISDDFDVFVAFETMNNRGKKLSDLELLKNRLIYLTTLYPDQEVAGNVKNKVRSNINQAWKEIYFQLGRNKHKPLNDDDFLKAHWIMYFKYSRKKGNDYINFLLDEFFSPKNIFEKVKVYQSTVEEIEEVRENSYEVDEDEVDDVVEDVDTVVLQSKLKIQEINDYVGSLKSAAKHWYNSFNPEHNSDLMAKERLLLDRLNRIGIGYFRPLVMSSFTTESVSSEERITLFEAIERFIFLAFRLSRAQSNYRNSSFYNATRELYRGEKSIADVLKMIGDDLVWVFNEDGTFKETYFADFIYRKFKTGGEGYYKWNGLRYFLFEYEEGLMQVRGQPKIAWNYFVKSEKDKVSIEHIYPQTADKPCWEQYFGHFTEEEKRYLTGSLGNLLPLSSSINSSLQNNCFEEKKYSGDSSEKMRNGYENGSYSEQEVAAYAVWDSDAILDRGLRLLSFMEKRWDIVLNESAKMKLLHLEFLHN